MCCNRFVSHSKTSLILSQQESSLWCDYVQGSADTVDADLLNVKKKTQRITAEIDLVKILWIVHLQISVPKCMHVCMYIYIYIYIYIHTHIHILHVLSQICNSDDAQVNISVYSAHCVPHTMQVCISQWFVFRDLSMLKPNLIITLNCHFVSRYS